MDGDAVIFLKRRYRLWLSRPVDGRICSGCFAQDARGRWYLNLELEVAGCRDCGSGNGAEYIEVDEHFTTQVCSGCGAVSGPKGIAHLGVREWMCSECGVQHDRDINSAINILVSGRNVALQRTEIPVL